MKQLLRYLLLLLGFFCIALGIVFLVNSGLGAPPWDVFHLGLKNHVPLTHGQISQIIGVLLIITAYLAGVKPKLGTVLNMFLVGLFIDLINLSGIIPLLQGQIFLQVAFMICGVLLMGFGTATYITADMGTGPRDSLMMAVSLKLPWSLGNIRTAIEISITLTGFALGGPLGIATIVFALTVGYTMELGFFIYRSFEKKEERSVTSE